MWFGVDVFDLKLLSVRNLMSWKINALRGCSSSLFLFLDAILNMVNNIAANVLGGKPELESGAETGGTDFSEATF